MAPTQQSRGVGIRRASYTKQRKRCNFYSKSQQIEISRQQSTEFHPSSCRKSDSYDPLYIALRLRQFFQITIRLHVSQRTPTNHEAHTPPVAAEPSRGSDHLLIRTARCRPTMALRAGRGHATAKHAATAKQSTPPRAILRRADSCLLRTLQSRRSISCL